MIFDGRTLSGSGLDAGTIETQPLEPTLSPSEAPADASEGSAPRSETGDALTAPVTTPARAEAQSLAVEAPADSQSIGRIRLRKAELHPAESATERRSRAPNTRIDRSESAPPDSPRSLHEAFDSIDLDRLAESIRPIWEAPASRRVTALGDDPEVVVHYPPEWQPPPSERRRMRASWEVTPTLPLSFAPPPSDTLDDHWESPVAPDEAPVPVEVTAAAEPRPGEPPHAAEPPTLERIAAPDSSTALDAHEPAPEFDARVGKSGGPGLESTAPIAVNQPPTAAPRSSRAKLWGAGLAAAALVALVWRGSGSPADPPVAGTDTPKSTALGEVAARVDNAPVSPPPAPATARADATALTDATALADATAAPSAALAVEPPAASPAPPSRLTAPTVTTSTPPPEAARHSPQSAPPTRARAPEPPPAAAVPPPEARGTEPTQTEPTGPDPSQVARALSAAAVRAHACSAADAPTGDGSIRVLLNPAGGVLNATALGGFQGTSAGACVENAFRSAQTPAYGGRSLSTVYPFSLIVH